MSEPLDDEAEVLDGLPVLPDEPADAGTPATATSRALASPLAAPAQAAAAAVGGFVAGAAVVGLVHRRQVKRRQMLLGSSSGRSARRLGLPEQGSRRAVGELVQVVASRSFLVDVHLLGSSGAQR